jgi:hypothetical protein
MVITGAFAKPLKSNPFVCETAACKGRGTFASYPTLFCDGPGLRDFVPLS